MNDRWQQNFDDVRAYIKEHDCEMSDIPYDVKTTNGITMQNWLKEQYLTYMGRTIHSMSDERRAVLREFGIESYRNKYDNEFYKVMLDLKAFCDENGFENVKRNKVFGKSTGVDLSSWINVQRRRYKSGKMKPRYIQWLQDFDMMYILENPFDLGYRHALEFRSTYGNLEMPTAYVCEDGFRLGKWCVNMRDRRKKGEATDEQIRKLNEIGFNWETNHVRREVNDTPSIQRMSALFVEFEDKQGMTHAEEYFKEYKKMNVPADYTCEDGFRLGLWLDVIRIRFHGSGVLTEIAEKLKSMRFSWKIKSEKKPSYFDKAGLEYAKKYFVQYHHLNIPKDYVTDDGYELGNWLSTIRTKHTNGQLVPQMIVELQELYIIWNQADINWFEIWEDCRRFVIANPGITIPRDAVSASGTLLNTWFRKNHG